MSGTGPGRDAPDDAGDGGAVGGAGELTHLDAQGRARMVDVGAKAVTARTAVARALLRCSPSTAALLVQGRLPKGDALAVARVAGIQAAKRTPELIPLCHTVALTAVEVDAEVDAAAGIVELRATCTAADRTGVEMEALTAASVAALTVYDMIKGVERGARIEAVELLHKAGGARGEWTRES